jgi:hypothetical protein
MSSNLLLVPGQRIKLDPSITQAKIRYENETDTKKEIGKVLEIYIKAS